MIKHYVSIFFGFCIWGVISVCMTSAKKSVELDVIYEELYNGKYIYHTDEKCPCRLNGHYIAYNVDEQRVRYYLQRMSDNYYDIEEDRVICNKCLPLSTVYKHFKKK